MARPETLSKGKIFDILHKAMPEGGLALEQDDPTDNPLPGGQPDIQEVKVAETPPEPVEPKVPDVPAEPKEPVLAQPPDPWADAEEIEYDDSDFDKKYKVKAPKSEAEAIRKGFMRQSDYSKKTAYLSKYKPLFETLISSGGIETAAAVWERGQQDPAYRDFVLEAYYRANTGRPLKFADDVQNQPVQQPVDDVDDPLGIRAALKPVVDDLSALKSEKDRQTQWEQQRAAVNRASQTAQAQTYSDFAAYFPNEFSGDPARDEQTMMKVYRYAERAGLLVREGAMQDPSKLPSAMLKAKLEMDRAQSATPPSAALSAAQANEQFERQAREKLAASMGTGGGNPPAPKPAPKPKVSGVDARGKDRPVGAVFKEMVAARGLE